MKSPWHVASAEQTSIVDNPLWIRRFKIHILSAMGLGEGSHHVPGVREG
jgi:hypothetical protein